MYKGPYLGALPREGGRKGRADGIDYQSINLHPSTTTFFFLLLDWSIGGGWEIVEERM